MGTQGNWVQALCFESAVAAPLLGPSDSAVGCNIPLSKTMFIIRWEQAVLHNIMFNKYEAASQMVNRGFPQVVFMLRYVNIAGDMEGIACALVEGVLIRMWVGEWLDV